MRFGSNPYKHDSKPVEPPREVTVAVLVFIPHLSGYFEQRLEILKLSLASLRRHTDVPYDLMVFDNGSCPEVLGYLLGLYDQGVIRYLLLSGQNVLKTGAYNMIFAAAPGKYVAFSDDDVFFGPGWLSATLRVFGAYPKAGMVSAQPTWDNFGMKNAATLAEAHRDELISTRRQDDWRRDWAEDFAEAKGSPIEQYVADCKDKEILLLERNGVQAYATCSHCQYVVRRSAAATALPVPLGSRLVDDAEFDRRLDAAGYMRLSTSERYTQHMGNWMSPRLRRLAESHSLGDDLPPAERERVAYAPAAPLRPLLRWLFGRSLPYRVLYRIYHESFQLISWRAAERKRELSGAAGAGK